MANDKLPPVPPDPTSPPSAPPASSKPPTDPAPAAPAFKLAKGVEVTYFQLRTGGAVEAFRAKVTALCTAPPGSPALERVDLEFQVPMGKRYASEIRRGRGAIDAPCWTPV